MAVELRYIVLFLLISFISSESVRDSERKDMLTEQPTVCSKDSGLLACLSEKVNALAAYISSAPEEKISKCETTSSAVKGREHIPMPFFLNLMLRQTDWFSHYKVPLSQTQDFKALKNRYLYKLFVYPKQPNNVYILPLKYYIYALEKIIT